MEIGIAVAVTFVLAFFLGRGSVKLTYGGKIVTEVTEAGTTRYSLEIATDIDKLKDKRQVIFKVVPPQDALL